MRLFYWGNDGGKESTVKGFWLIEIKWLFSIVLLRFDGESREAYHTHAFNAFSILFKGILIEQHYKQPISIIHVAPGFIITKRNTYHKVDSVERSWVLSFRGPWNKTWKEYLPNEKRERILSNGRIEVTEASEHMAKVSLRGSTSGKIKEGDE